MMATARFDLSGKTALITGSGSGLGFAIARGLAEAGARVVLNGRDRAKLEPRPRRCCAASGLAVEVARSTSPTRRGAQPASPRAAWPGSVPIDILVNNAGIQHRAPIEEFSDDDWRRLMATNLDAPFYLARAVIPAMQARRAGKIINIGSLMSSLARPTTVPYQTSKGGIAMLTRGLARRAGAARHPGERDRAGVLPHRDERRAHRRTRSSRAWVEKRTPAGRWAEPHELAGAAVFLASPAAALRDRAGPLRRRRLHRRHVGRRLDTAQFCPSVSASSWNRPSLLTSQISVNLTVPANRVGFGSGPGA